MAERKEYQIKVQGVLVEVTKEVYLAYYSIERHTRTLDEKDERNGKVLYSALDTEETLGEEMIPDIGAASVEEVALGNILCEKLHQCLALLPEKERELLHALYFEGLTERECAQRIGISQKGVNKRRHKIMDKLRAMMKI